MAYPTSIAIQVGLAAWTTKRWTLVDAAGIVAGLKDQTTGFQALMDVDGKQIVIWRYSSVPDGFDGVVILHDGVIGAGTDFSGVRFIAPGSLTPRETENADVKTGSRMATFTYTSPDNVGIAALQTTIGIAGVGLTDLGGMSTTMRSQVNAEADTALADYDAPTNAEMVARTLVTADYATAADQATLLAAVQNVQNNTFISTSIPLTLERPDAGSATVNISIVFADETGAAKNLDSGNPIITLVNDVGADLSSRLGMFTNPATGKYVVPYTNTVGDTIEGLHWDVSGTINGKLRRLPAYTQIVDTTAVDFTAADRTNLEAILEDTGTTIPSQIVAVPDAVDAVLSLAHDSGSWASAGSLTDWTDAEREQIRDALGVDGDKEPAVDGQLQDIPGDVDDVLTLAHGADSWQSGSSTFGAGAAHVELIILDTNNLPIAGAAVWITTGDDPETGVVAGTEVSDAFGSRNFMLDPSPIEQEGEVQSAAASSVTLEAAASSVDGAYNRKIVRITAGTGVDQSRVISDYNGSGRLATLSTAWTVQPDGTSHYQVVEPYRRWCQLSGVQFAENPSLFDVR